MLHEIKTLRSRREEAKTFIKKPIGGQCSGGVSAQETCDSKQKQFNLNGGSVSNKEDIETQWPVIVAVRRKIRSQTRHIGSKPIPVTHNRYKCSVHVILLNVRTQFR
jgi:hypothetical protein